MLQYDFEESIGYWICSTAHGIEQALNEELTPHGITYRQWQVLGWLAFEGELTLTQLAERLRIEAPTLVGILDRMERDQWITREPDPLDRRRKLIKPTERVKPVWNKIVTCARKVRTEAAKNLSAEELETIKKAMAIIQSNLKNRKLIEEPVT